MSGRRFACLYVYYVLLSALAFLLLMDLAHLDISKSKSFGVLSAVVGLASRNGSETINTEVAQCRRKKPANSVKSENLTTS